MGVYRVTGGGVLEGCICIHGAKNSVLPIMAATLAWPGQYCIENCPDISDVDVAQALLRHLGCITARTGACIHIDTIPAQPRRLPAALVGQMRATVLFLGAMLTRFGAASMCRPGGCPLGDRPIDLHLMGLRQMGAVCTWEEDRLVCQGENLQGCTVSLLFPSVGATENLLLAALGCRGTLRLCNAAREPEIFDLIAFLNACGARISGAGSGVLTVEGGHPLHGGTFSVMPDRMEAATYLAAAAITGGTLCLKQVCPAHLVAVTQVLTACGCTLHQKETELTLHGGKLRAVSPIQTGPYPAFPTDAQAPVMAVMTLAEGTSIFEERVFPERFCHCPALKAMGAEIHATRRYAAVRGVRRLHGAKVAATDLRGGAALVLAALAAEGESTITHTEHMERGYTAFVQTLQSCGAQIFTEEG